MVLAAYRAKVVAAQAHREVIKAQDWSGLRAIINTIVTAFS
jgi:hypothetical protein